MSVWCGNPFASAGLHARSKSASAMRMVTFFEARASRARRCAVPRRAVPSLMAWVRVRSTMFGRSALVGIVTVLSFAGHRVTPEEVEQMFANDEMGIDYDQARVLIVVFTMRDDAVRHRTNRIREYRLRSGARAHRCFHDARRCGSSGDGLRGQRTNTNGVFRDSANARAKQPCVRGNWAASGRC